MESYILPPKASSLSESMRDIGYSIETAIADIIDNSISAAASSVNIWLDFNHGPSLGIIDNGDGLSYEELLDAMRHGSSNPRIERNSEDLGRFGLGLKTASFSQCRHLTVISRKHGKTVGAVWDLDIVAEKDAWELGILNQEEIQSSIFIDRLGHQGTLVLWKKLDRLCEGESTTERQRKMLYEKLDTSRKHLALVFHRYLSGEVRNRSLDICINGDLIEPFDPFCFKNKATQLLPEEIINIANKQVKIQPYILPHHGKLSKKEYDFYRSRSDFVSNQGAYIYRNNRLMAWGDWFRLVPKTEATKLARVGIDFSNGLDEHWTIDIKKSRAHPPYQVREKLKQIINRIIDHSKRIHIGRGNRLFQEQEKPLWVRYIDKIGIRYEINREHPLLEAIETKLDAEIVRGFKNILSIIEKSLPLEAIYSDYASSPQLFEEKSIISYEELKEILHNLYELSLVKDKEVFSRMVYGLKPFNEHREMTEKIIEELNL